MFLISIVALFQEYYINGIRQYVTFGDWLFPISIMPCRSVQVVWASGHYVFIAEWYSMVGHICLTFHPLRGTTAPFNWRCQICVCKAVCGVPLLSTWCLQSLSGYLSPLSFVILVTCLFSPSFIIPARDLSILWIFSNNQLFVLLIFSTVILFSSSLISVLDYFLPSAYFRFVLFFLNFLEVETEMIHLRLFLFSNANISFYKFPSQRCFNCIIQVLICCFSFSFDSVFFFNFPWDFPFNSWII